MNKGDLVCALARRTGMTKVDSAIALDSVLQIISDTLADGGMVRLADFGTFEVVNRAPRTGRNPRKNIEVTIPGRKVPVFKAHKALKSAVL